MEESDLSLCYTVAAKVKRQSWHGGMAVSSSHTEVQVLATPLKIELPLADVVA